MQVGNSISNNNASASSLSTTPAASALFDVQAYVNYRLGCRRLPPSAIVNPRSYEQSIEPYSSARPKGSRYQNIQSSGDNRIINKILNTPDIKMEALALNADDLDKMLILKAIPLGVPLGYGGGGGLLQSSSQQRLQFKGPSMNEMSGLGGVSGGVGLSTSVSNSNLGLNIVIPRSANSSNNLVGQGSHQQQVPTSLPSSSSSTAIFNPSSNSSNNNNNSTSATTAATSAPSKRPAAGVAEIEPTGNSKKLKFTQSNSNISAMTSDQGVGLTRAMSASASLSSFGNSSSQIPQSKGPPENIAYADLKVIMKAICDEFWNYDFGKDLEIKKAFRSKVTQSTCYVLFGLETYAEEDSSLVTIKERINSHYKTAEQFEMDFRMMFYNMIQYFPTNHVVSEKAKQLSSHFEVRWAAAKASVSKK